MKPCKEKLIINYKAAVDITILADSAYRLFAKSSGLEIRCSPSIKFKFEIILIFRSEEADL